MMPSCRIKGGPELSIVRKCYLNMVVIGLTLSCIELILLMFFRT